MSLQPSFFEHLEDRLNLAVFDINAELRMQRTFDTRKISKDELIRELDEADREAGTTERHTSWDGEILRVDWPEKQPANQPAKQEMRVSSAVDRLKAKALQARVVAPDAIKAFEADLDSLISQKPILDQRRADAVAPHKEAIAATFNELDGLKAAIDLMSNGGPSLDPLPGSTNSAPGS